MSALMGETATSTDPRVGSRLGSRYRLDARIAAGGMAVVYRGTDEVLGRPVAVKLMHPALGTDPGFVERFRREAQNAARLNHANVAMVHDWGTEDGCAYMVMELVEGTSLRDLVERFGRLDVDTVRSVVAGVAAALDHAHERGIVHRDIKPENVLLTGAGQVKVVDFGVARALGPEAARLTSDAPLGTVAYIAPEQLTDGDVDGRADIYALGIMAYEMLTGRPAFTGETPAAIAAARLTASVPSPGISPDVDGAVARATALHPSDRFGSAGSFSHALGESALPTHLQHTDEVVLPAVSMPTTVLPPLELGSRSRPRERRRSRRRWVLVALVLLLVSGAATAGAVLQPWMTDVPDVAGATPERATNALRSAGLAPGPIEEVFSDSVDRGAVVRTDPAPGSPVRMFTSKGPEFLTIPTVIGKSLEDAKDLIARAGFEVGNVEEAFHNTIAAGSVAAQDPAPDAGQLERGSEISLVVSKGPDLVTVPDVSGKTPAQAKAALEAAGLVYDRVDEFSDSVALDQIIRSDPSSGKRAVRGSRVKVVVSRGPRAFAMPSLVGMSLDAAKAKARELGLVVANEYAVPGSGKPKGEVQGQNPPAGTEVRKGTRIDLHYAG